MAFTLVALATSSVDLLWTSCKYSNFSILARISSAGYDGGKDDGGAVDERC